MCMNEDRRWYCQVGNICDLTHVFVGYVRKLGMGSLGFP